MRISKDVFLALFLVFVPATLLVFSTGNASPLGFGGVAAGFESVNDYSSMTFEFPTLTMVEVSISTRISTSTVYSERISTSTSVSVQSVSFTTIMTQISTTTSSAGMLPGVDPSLNTPLLVAAIVIGAVVGGAVTTVSAARSSNNRTRGRRNGPLNQQLRIKREADQVASLREGTGTATNAQPSVGPGTQVGSRFGPGNVSQDLKISPGHDPSIGPGTNAAATPSDRVIPLPPVTRGDTDRECPHCNMAIPKESAFCLHCGLRLKKS